MSDKGKFGEPWSEGGKLEPDSIASFDRTFEFEIWIIGPADRYDTRPRPNALEIRRRVIACVNACDGVLTEDLEGGVLRDLAWPNLIAPDCREHAKCRAARALIDSSPPAPSSGGNVADRSRACVGAGGEDLATGEGARDVQEESA